MNSPSKLDRLHAVNLKAFHIHIHSTCCFYRRFILVHPNVASLTSQTLDSGTVILSENVLLTSGSLSPWGEEVGQ